jgi:hypothetical protein
VSGLAVVQGGADQQQPMERVNAILDDFDLPNVLAVFRRKFREWLEPLPHTFSFSLR